MQPESRRAVLRRGAAAGIAGLAGCLGRGGTETGTATGVPTAGTWLQFAHDERNTGVALSSGPATGATRRWRNDAGDDWTGPVFDGARMVAGNAKGFLDGIDRATGAQRWRFETGAPVLATPALDDDTAYAVDRAGTVYALDTAGEPRWTRELGGPRTRVERAPTLGDGTLYVGTTDGRLMAIGTDGRRRWAYDMAGTGGGLSGTGASTPAVAGGRVYVGSPSTVDCIGTDGQRRWRATTGAPTFGPVVDSGSGTTPNGPSTIYAATAAGEVVALGGQTGERRWRTALDAAATTPPAVTGETVVVGSETGLVALAADSGARAWTVATEAPVAGAPVVAEGVVYAGTGRRGLYAFDAADGSERWTGETVGTAAPPAVADGTLFVAAGNRAGARLAAYTEP